MTLLDAPSTTSAATLRWHRVDPTLWVATTGVGATSAHAGLVQRIARGFDARDELNRPLGVFISHNAATQAVASVHSKNEAAS
ncbi:hypothetical protein [Schumannella soli]|uniref:Uncharacterized protein n=1 Tax=Schumannella soli TaxID=2590779 RepID=A0A506Y676_9MICO|nr:hypothetical protein [Schumannella soli]TPW77522.1 hypothetical protein FJ657_02245 [Schumannella soli]